MAEKKLKIQVGIKKAAVLIVLRADQKYLLLKRAKEPNQGLYTPVGGKIDPFETPPAAALRETKEETGIEVSDIHYAGTLVETAPTKYNWITFVYWADINWRPAPECPEGVLEWIEEVDLQELPTPPTDWHIYQYIQKGKPFNLMAELDGDLHLFRMEEVLEGKVLVGEE